MDILYMLSQIDTICRKKGIKKADLYNGVGITSAAVSQWRTGKTTPASTSIENLANFLGVPMSDLIGEKKEKPVLNEDELDEETKELRNIWDTSDLDERKALLEMARLIKKRREK